MRSSITNKTSIFGIMGGLYNRKISGRSSMNRVTSRLEIPAGAKEGYQYMKIHNLLSRNPLGSGGVGKMNKVSPWNEELFKPEPNKSPCSPDLSTNRCYDNSGRAICPQCCQDYITADQCQNCIEGVPHCLGVNPSLCHQDSNDYQIHNILENCTIYPDITSEECLTCINKNIPNTCYTMKMPLENKWNVKRLGYKFDISNCSQDSFCCEFGYNDISGCTDSTKVCDLSNNNMCDISSCDN